MMKNVLHIWMDVDEPTVKRHSTILLRKDLNFGSITYQDLVTAQPDRGGQYETLMSDSIGQYRTLLADSSVRHQTLTADRCEQQRTLISDFSAQHRTLDIADTIISKINWLLRVSDRRIYEQNYSVDDENEVNKEKFMKSLACYTERKVDGVDMVNACIQSDLNKLSLAGCAAPGNTAVGAGSPSASWAGGADGASVSGFGAGFTSVGGVTNNNNNSNSNSNNGGGKRGVKRTSEQSYGGSSVGGYAGYSGGSYSGGSGFGGGYSGGGSFR